MQRERYGSFGPPTEPLTVNVVAPAASLGNVTFIHTDGLGSPVARTDGAGNLISRTYYEPYGNTAAGAQPTMGFTGHVNDAGTGLTYMQQRYYDPVAGRFLSIDPVVTDANTGGSFSRYAYASNNPYRNIDPDGRTPLDVAFLVWDIGKLGGAIYSGVGIGPAMIDVAISTAGVFSPVPGAGQVYKAVRIGETVRAAEHVVEGASSAARTITSADVARQAAKAEVLSARTAPELKAIYGWGNGEAGVAAARQALDPSTMERIQSSVSKAEVLATRKMYQEATATGRGGAVAPARAEYMDEILKAWKE